MLEVIAIKEMMSIWTVPTRITSKRKAFDLPFIRATSQTFGLFDQVLIYRLARSVPILGDRYDLVSVKVTHPKYGVIYDINLTRPPVEDSEISWEDEDISHLTKDECFKTFKELENL